jgi:hypothetical protein
MSYLLIREFPELAATQAPEGQVLAVAEPAILETQVIVSSIPVVFGPFQPATRWVELCAQTTCSILIGLSTVTTAGSITTGNGRLQSNDRVIRRIPFSANQLPGFPVRGAPNGSQGNITNSLSVSAVICSST